MVYLRNKQVSKKYVNSNPFHSVNVLFSHRDDCFLFFNQLSLNLSKKPVEEPNDESADSVIAGIVEKILRESGIRGVVVNSRIINVFRKKISLLYSAFKKFSRRGGKSISKLIDSWKVKNYSFKIFYHELQSN